MRHTARHAPPQLRTKLRARPHSPRVGQGDCCYSPNKHQTTLAVATFRPFFYAPAMQAQTGTISLRSSLKPRFYLFVVPGNAFGIKSRSIYNRGLVTPSIGHSAVVAAGSRNWGRNPPSVDIRLLRAQSWRGGMVVAVALRRRWYACQCTSTCK